MQARQTSRGRHSKDITNIYRLQRSMLASTELASLANSYALPHLFLHQPDGVLRVSFLGLLGLRDGAGANSPQGLFGLVGELLGHLGEVFSVLPRHPAQTNVIPKTSRLVLICLC